MTEEALAEIETVESAPQEDEVLEIEENIEVPLETDSQAAEVAEPGEKAPEIRDSDPESVQNRMNKITSDKYAAQAEAKEAREELAKAREKLATFNKEPGLDDPDINHDQEKFKQKYGAWLQEQNSNTTTAAPQAETAKAEKVAAFGKKVGAFVTETPDYYDVVGKMPIGQDASDAILEMDNGPAVAYYLAQRLDLVDELNDLSPASAALRVLELSRKLGQPAPNKMTQAPDPVASVTTGGGTTTKKPEDMSIEELDAVDAAQERA
jgi:hypothetical protein